MSPMKLVGIDALSTALSPLTPVAPPAEVLIESQPGPSGWQLTEGSEAALVVGARTAELAGRTRVVGLRRARGRSAAAALRPAVPWGLDPVDAIDGVLKGPVNSAQPLAQPVAAGPTNVGENWPKLDVLTPLT
ncbi:MAG TPA: hypothetical protein VF781_01320 [Solirubrobacteraceae bacterium]